LETFDEYFTCKFDEMTVSSPFIYTFLSTYLPQGIDGDIDDMLGICVRNMPCTTHIKRLL